MQKYREVLFMMNKFVYEEYLVWMQEKTGSVS